MRRGRTAPGVDKERLLSSFAGIVDGCAQIKKVRVQHGDSLTWQVNASKQSPSMR